METEENINAGEPTSSKQAEQSIPSSPVFNPPKLKFPKHIHTPIDEKFEKLAGTIFQHCNDEVDMDAPVYDMPQLPIEENQMRSDFARQFSHKARKTGSRTSSGAPSPSTSRLSLNTQSSMPSAPLLNGDIENFEFDFQRVKVSGDDTSGVPAKDLRQASEALVKALMIREKYMAMALHSFPRTTAQFLQKLDKNTEQKESGLQHEEQESELQHEEQKTIEDHPIHPPATSGDPFVVEIVDDNLGCLFSMKEGVCYIYRDRESLEKGEALEFPYPDRSTFLVDHNVMLTLMADGPLKSFCFRRLKYLSAKFNLHTLLNEMKEAASQKEVPHRDFYNVRKVDTHVHASSCMNQKHLLRFIKKMMKKNANQSVCKNMKGKEMTLKEVLTGYLTLQLSKNYFSKILNSNSFDT